jgi:23S rRNA (pseudouridine1915-N3)-methyltransferase
MRIRILAIGSRMPRWVEEAVDDYTRRLGPKLKVTWTEIPAGQRTAGRDTARAVSIESERLLAALRADEFVVALDERGKLLSTRELADWLHQRMQDGRDLVFVIGGPDGLAAEVLARSDLKLSLSKLTFPHALVRVVLAEQLYRAHTVLTGHPYHRD